MTGEAPENAMRSWLGPVALLDYQDIGAQLVLPYELSFADMYQLRRMESVHWAQ